MRDDDKLLNTFCAGKTIERIAVMKDVLADHDLLCITFADGIQSAIALAIPHGWHVNHTAQSGVLRNVTFIGVDMGAPGGDTTVYHDGKGNILPSPSGE